MTVCNALSLGERCMTFQSHYELQNLGSLLTENTVPHPERHEPLLYCIYPHAAEALVAATREIGLEVSADKTKYMVMSRDQYAGRIHSVRTDNSTFKRVEEFKYLGTSLTNQNSVAEEIKSRLRSGNA